jgi:SAM-dependent methyltransferase
MVTRRLHDRRLRGRVHSAQGPPDRRARILAPLPVGALAGTTGGMALWWWWRLHPAPEPFAESLWVRAPHPGITRRRLHEILAVRGGERILEVGCGSGRYAVEVARWLGPGGQLDAFDRQQRMLDWTAQRAAARGLDNVVTRCGDACALPYASASFDAAYAISTLGQVPERTRALAELARVLGPGGRLVVGEVAYDPHGLFPEELRRAAAGVGLRLQGRLGNGVGYFACFTPA